MNTDEPQSPAMSLERISLASTIDLVEIVVRRRRVFAACVGMGILAGLFYYGVVATRMYESAADLLLIQRRPEAVTRDQQRYESSFEDYLATHRALIVSPMIVSQAIESADLGALQSFSGVEPEDLAYTIIEQMTVTSGPRDLGDSADNIMTLTFQGPEAEECPLVVQAILDSYRAFLGETYRGMSNETVRLIGEARDLLKYDLQQNEDAYIEFRRGSPLVARGTSEVNPLEDRLAAIETRRTDLLLRRAQIEGQLKSLDSARQKGYDDHRMTAFVTSLQNELSTASQSGGSALDGQLAQLTDREQQLLAHLGSKHPHLVALRKRIDAVRQMQALPTGAQIAVDAETVDDAPESAAVEIVEQYASYLEQELDWINTSEDLLSRLYEEEHASAQKLSGYQLKDEGFRRTIELTQQLYEGVIGQLQEASLVKDFGGFDALVIASPEVGEKVSPRGKIVLALSGMLGALLGLSMAVFFELRDKSFRSRADIQSRLGLKVLAQVPRFAYDTPSGRHESDAGHVLSPMLCTHHDPGSRQSEAFRSLRTALLFNPHTAGLRMLQFTSPSPGDGTSTIAANLAISIAQLGRRVLLIDADLRSPKQHELFGVASQLGLTSVITSGVAASDAICKTNVEGLSLLPAGPQSDDVSEPFTSPRFTEMLASLRNQYDYVLLDTEPLLTVSDPCVIASQVDGVLLGLRPTKDSRWRAVRANEILATIGVQAIGAVVNGIGETAAWGYQTTREFDPTHAS